MRAFSSSCFLMMLLFASGNSLHAVEWKQYSFDIPDGWQMVRDDRDAERASLELEAEGWPIKILLNLTAQPLEPDEKYNKQPGMAGVSLGLPVALQLAGEAGEKAVSQSFGVISVGSTQVPSAWLSVLSEESASAFHLHCFVHATHQALIAGILLVEVPIGQVVEAPEFEARIQEAYGFFRSIKVLSEP